MVDKSGNTPLGSSKGITPRLRVEDSRRSTHYSLTRQGQKKNTTKTSKPEIGDMSVGNNPTKPLTRNEKKMLARLQKFGRSQKKKRYENYKSRTNSQNMVNKGGGGGTKTRGGIGLGFNIYLDKKDMFNGLEKGAAGWARMAHTITQRVALNDGKAAAEMALRIASHLGGKRRSTHVDGDIFSRLISTLHCQEDFSTTENIGQRYIRHWGGSYADGEWPGQEPTGLKGHHTGKNVNLSEMYEDGTGQFSYSDKIYFLVAAAGARRSRGDNYIAALKGKHPGFPAVQYMSKWTTTTQIELSQKNYDHTLAIVMANNKNIMPGTGMGY